jgi:hypothetical protein
MHNEMNLTLKSKVQTIEKGGLKNRGGTLS